LTASYLVSSNTQTLQNGRHFAPIKIQNTKKGFSSYALPSVQSAASCLDRTRKCARFIAKQPRSTPCLPQRTAAAPYTYCIECCIYRIMASMNADRPTSRNDTTPNLVCIRRTSGHL
jgi:hypothetical protein